MAGLWDAFCRIRLKPGIIFEHWVLSETPPWAGSIMMLRICILITRILQGLVPSGWNIFTGREEGKCHQEKVLSLIAVKFYKLIKELRNFVASFVTGGKSLILLPLSFACPTANPPATLSPALPCWLYTPLLKHDLGAPDLDNGALLIRILVGLYWNHI